MKFYCLCLSPAIDATVRLNAWPTDGCVIKDAADTFAPGGKAVNVARWLAVRGASVACGGLLGEDNAVVFEREFAKYGIEDRFLRVSGATRVNEMFVTPEGNFKVNRPAFPGLEVGAAVPRGPQSFFDEAALVGDCGAQGTARPTVVVLSGSLPRDFPVDYYRTLVATAKAAGAKVVLDASGKALVEGVKAHPDVIKPNAEECEALIGFVPKTPEDFKRATAALKAVCDFPIISDGGAGCWFDGAFVVAPKVDVLDTTSAGDTLLAEWCWRRFEGFEKSEEAAHLSNQSDSARWAVAAGSAACTMPGGEPPPVELVSRLASPVSRPLH